MSPIKFLITGATGYIGGSVLSTLLSSKFKDQIEITAVVRSQDQAEKLREKGIKAELFKGLDDVEKLRSLATEADVVINTASASSSPAAKALIQGLSGRQKAHPNSRQPHLIHTSGTSSLGDNPVTKIYTSSPSEIHSDTENTYQYLLQRESKQKYHQRTCDLTVIGTGLSESINTTIIMSPTIYGTGTGLFNRTSIQVPLLTRTAVQQKHAVQIGDGTGVWDYVHVEDLMQLYDIVISKVIQGETVPTGEKGVLFSETGRFSWGGLAQDIATALVRFGALSTTDVYNLGIEDAAALLTGGDLVLAEEGFSSNSRTEANMSRQLGWKPVKAEEDWKQHIQDIARDVAGAK